MRFTDFAFVPEGQLAMHARLENWGRSCNGGQRKSSSPMFGQYQSTNHWVGYALDIKVPEDVQDARRVARGVAFLPEPHRLALHWYYVKRASVMQGRKAIGCTAEMLAVYVIDARTMLINRGV